MSQQIIDLATLARFRAGFSVHPVNPQGECWLWKATTGNGYGIFQGEGAHVFSFRLFRGEIPLGFHVHHQCQVKACVNPHHLKALPAGEHIRKHQAKLGPNDVRRIRASGHSNRVLAADYGVTPTTITNIKAGHTWNDGEKPKRKRIGNRKQWFQTVKTLYLRHLLAVYGQSGFDRASNDDLAVLETFRDETSVLAWLASHHPPSQGL